jgi:DNA modification methylase
MGRAKSTSRARAATSTRRIAEAATALPSPSPSKPEVRRIPISDLVPWAGNPRRISDEALAGLDASIARFGCVEPIVWNRRTGRVVGGHQRLKVLQARGAKETYVVVVDLPEVEEHALNVALNNPHIAGAWTPDVREILRELAADFDAFKDLRFDDLLDEVSRTTLRNDTDHRPGGEDDAQEPPAEPVTRPGDVWHLGPHRIVCGDCTDPAVLRSLMGRDTAYALFTDPPYGVDYCPEERGATRGRGVRPARRNEQSAGDRGDHPGRGARRARENAHCDVLNDHHGRRNGHSVAPARGRILNDDLSGEQLQDLLGRCFAAADTVLKPGSPVYLCAPAGREAGRFWAAWPDGWHFQAALVWHKGRFALSRWDYHPGHELMLYGWKKGADHTWLGKRDQSTVWEIEMGQGRHYIHPTQKPVALVRRALLNSALEGEIVLDTFGGSGSTLIAAETCGRRARLVELDPRFVDAAVQRWERYTGSKAELRKAS